MDGNPTSADILRRVAARLWDVAPCSPLAIRREHRLDSDFNLDGYDLLRVAELLEEEFSITISPGDVADVALRFATVGGLCDLVEQALADA